MATSDTSTVAGEEVKAAEENGWQDVSPPEYLKQVTDLKFLNISIKGYEKKSSTGFPKEEYYGYRIVSILAPSSVELPSLGDSSSKVRQEVWRRYSEFEALRHFLTTVYPHIVVPPLPEKSSVRGSSGLLNKLTFTGEDSSFLQKRQQALEIFLVRISRHPILCRNYWFHDFLKNIGWREAAQNTGYATKAESLFQTLSLQLSKQKIDSGPFQDVKEYADDLETAFKLLLEVRDRMNGCLMAVYKVHGNYGRVFSEWSETENTLGTSFQIAGGCMDSYAESIDTYFEEEEFRYLLPLKEYITYCDSLRAVIRRHELLQRQSEKAEEILAAKKDAMETLEKEGPEASGGSGGGSGGGRWSWRSVATRLRGGDTSYEGRMATASRELQEAEENAQQAKKDLDSFTSKALEELERFSAQREADFSSILINYVQLQLHIHRKGVNTWERVKQGFETVH